MPKKIVHRKFLMFMSLFLLFIAYMIRVYDPGAVIASIASASQVNPDVVVASTARFLVRTNIPDAICKLCAAFGIVGVIFSFTNTNEKETSK